MTQTIIDKLERADGPRKRTTKERLARYMDPQAFAEKVGKERKEAMKSRREISLRRAEAAIRFFKNEALRARSQGGE